MSLLRGIDFSGILNTQTPPDKGGYDAPPSIPSTLDIPAIFSYQSPLSQPFSVATGSGYQSVTKSTGYRDTQPWEELPNPNSTKYSTSSPSSSIKPKSDVMDAFPWTAPAGVDLGLDTLSLRSKFGTRDFFSPEANLQSSTHSGGSSFGLKDKYVVDSNSSETMSVLRQPLEAVESLFSNIYKGANRIFEPQITKTTVQNKTSRGRVQTQATQPGILSSVKQVAGAIASALSSGGTPSPASRSSGQGNQIQSQDPTMTYVLIGGAVLAAGLIVYVATKD